MTDSIREYYSNILIEQETGTNRSKTLELDYYTDEREFFLEAEDISYFSSEGRVGMSLSREEATALHAFIGKHLEL